MTVPAREPSPLLFRIGRALFRVLFTLVWRMRIEGLENVPDSGGLIVAPNHRSLADPPLVGAALMAKRPLYFMAKQELFDVPVLGFLIRRTNAFPVKRGAQDVGALRNAVKLLKGGRAVLVFPEGGRSKDGGFKKAKAGVGMIACMARVPVLPVFVENTDRLGKLARVRVVFGRPVYPPEQAGRDSYQELADRVMDEIRRLG